MNTKKIFSIEITFRKVFIALCLAGIVVTAIADAKDKRTGTWWCHADGLPVTMQNMENTKRREDHKNNGGKGKAPKYNVRNPKKA